MKATWQTTIKAAFDVKKCRLREMIDIKQTFPPIVFTTIFKPTYESVWDISTNLNLRRETNVSYNP
jgi:hypothetical protein